MHPFRISWILALIDMRYYERRGSKLTGMRYVPGPGTFYIERFGMREGDPERGVGGCLEYVCEPPSLDVEVRGLVDEVIVSVTGGKGGVGKSTIASILAVTLACYGYNLVAADADVDTLNLYLALGVRELDQEDYGRDA